MFVEFKVNPVPSVCVTVVSESAPKLNTAESLNNLRSSPIIASAATERPPSVCSEPVSYTHLTLPTKRIV